LDVTPIWSEALLLKRLVVRFSVPHQIDPAQMGAWLRVVIDEPESGAPPKIEAVALGDGQLWLELVLQFSVILLQVLGAPVFEAVKVLSCDKEGFVDSRRGENKWKAICVSPDSRLVPPRTFEGVLQTAFKLAHRCAAADPYSSTERELILRFIDTDFRHTFENSVSRGKSTIELVRVAHRLNIPYYPLPGAVFQVGMGSAGCRIDRSTTERDSALGRRWANSKMLTAQLLRQAGLPAPHHVAITSIEQAKKAAGYIGFPLVVKPSDLERGVGVTVDVQEARLEAAVNKAVRHSPTKIALIEQQVSGVCHRMFVLDDKLLYAVQRLPIGVYADGRSTITQLVNDECQAQYRKPPWKRSGVCPLDDLALHTLSKQGWTANSIPESGRFVPLRRIENTAWGGVDIDVTETIHPDNAEVAIDAAKLLGLQVAGVDIISPDITQPWHSNGAIISEVNYAPLLGGGEISRSYIPSFLNTLIKDGGRIPIHVHLGGDTALSAARGDWKQMVNSGLKAAMVTPQQTLLSDGRTKIMPSANMYARCRSLILSPNVDALVLVLQDDEFLYSGLPFDSVTIVQDSGGELLSHRDKCLLDNQQASRLRRLVKSWERVADAGVREV